MISKKPYVLAACVAVLSLALPRTVAAEPAPRRLTIAIGAYLTASAADAVTTVLALRSNPGGAQEGNPLFTPLGRHPLALGAARLAGAGALAYWMKKAYPRHPRLTLTVAYVAVGSVSVIATRNARFLR